MKVKDTFSLLNIFPPKWVVKLSTVQAINCGENQFLWPVKGWRVGSFDGRLCVWCCYLLLYLGPWILDSISDPDFLMLNPKASVCPLLSVKGIIITKSRKQKSCDRGYFLKTTLYLDVFMRGILQLSKNGHICHCIKSSNPAALCFLHVFGKGDLEVTSWTYLRHMSSNSCHLLVHLCLSQTNQLRAPV